jgi:lipopolysaccharide transport protein LptA
MAASRHSNLIQSLVSGLSGAMLAALGLAAVAPVQAASSSNPIANCEIHIEGTDLGTKLSKSKGGDTRIDLPDAKITACDTKIVANHARGTSRDSNWFDDSTWTFTGDVHVELGEQQARLTSNEAVVQFRNKEVQRLTIKGDPAEFEQKRPKSEDVTRGHAKNIVYESAAGNITLQDDVWLNDSGREFTGPCLVYDIRNAQVGKLGCGREGDQNGQRIHITIPAAKDQKKQDDDKNPPAPTPP